MDEVLRKLDDLEKRISSIEKRLSPTPFEGVSGQGAPTPPAYRSDVAYHPPVDNRGVYSGLTTPQTVLGAQDKKEKKSIESYIGRKLLGLIGIIALVFGASFFLKWAFDNNIIGPHGRVALG